LKTAADLKNSWLIDYEGYYKGREDEAKKIFPEPLVVVDPVDKGRNVASALRRERLVEFVASSRGFLTEPRLKFFYPRETRAFTPKQLASEIKKRESALVFIKFDRVEAVPDVLWGQLYKTQRSLRKLLELNDFHVVRESVWSSEQDLNVLVFELEHGVLPLIKKHIGPPIRKKIECENFLRKHAGSPNTISGPYLESDRWVAEIKRRYSDARVLLYETLKDGGRRAGVAELISKAVKKALEVFVNEQIVKLYSSDLEFAKFLTDYLEAKPRWLGKDHDVKI
jgi:tRNA nucleotidyltransferase (CCA-adding enzyme)